MSIFHFIYFFVLITSLLIWIVLCSQHGHFLYMQGIRIQFYSLSWKQVYIGS